jgi:hypothetical protein
MNSFDTKFMEVLINLWKFKLYVNKYMTMTIGPCTNRKCLFRLLVNKQDHHTPCRELDVKSSDISKM